ncbi:hypothetical protein SS50377_23041 [Spironucleus salmonicida]|uniref:Uncharacterized protein n=1 Tax=Spironucleus salmonicida TaxID=348837 RepID=V6LTP3_9EUKA|nr:hypothetical protein SS50377_23041 [Spironucleus salmonicida]|eukprot:EST47618.1 Hypothetical protein SS50377_12313 [Spironucleus salmonicida]
MSYDLKDHAFCTQNDKTQHVVVRRIEPGSAFYVQNFGSGRLFPARLAELRPFDLEVAKTLKNKKTLAFVEQVLEGKVLRTAQKQFLFDGEVLREQPKRRGTLHNALELRFRLPHFLFAAQLPQVRVATETLQVQQESLSTYLNVCNNHSCIVLPTSAAAQLLEMKAQLPLAPAAPPKSGDLLGALARVRRGAVAAPLAEFQRDFLAEFAPVFSEGEIGTAEAVFALFGSGDVRQIVNFCNSLAHERYGLRERCMLVCIVDFLGQRQYQYFK